MFSDVVAFGSGSLVVMTSEVPSFVVVSADVSDRVVMLASSYVTENALDSVAVEVVTRSSIDLEVMSAASVVICSKELIAVVVDKALSRTDDVLTLGDV